MSAYIDLLERLARANSNLMDLADEHSDGPPSRVAHLRSKAEGVRLAISYVNEEIRREGVQS